MRDARALLRLTAVVLVAVLALTLAAPARAEADVLLAVGIAGIVIVVVIVVVYLVVASSRGDRMPAQAQPVMVACIDSDVEARSCWPVPASSGATATPAVDLRAPVAPMEAVPQS
jgi:hypothetical protein